MHVLITGAAGMIGRKLTERLVTDRGLMGHPVDKLTLYGQSGGQQRQGHHHGHYRSKAAFCERAFQKVCPMLKKKLIRRSVWVCSWPGVRMEKIVGFKL